MSMNKTKLWQQFQTYVIVSLITVLIWMYAESENVVEQKPLYFNVRFVPTPGQSLAIDPASPQQIQVKVRCAVNQYAELEKRQRQTIDLRLEEDPTNPVRLINLQQQLEYDPEIGPLGVEFLDVQPANLQAHVERFEDVALPVEAGWLKPNEVQLTGPLIPEPNQAVVRLPAGIARQVADAKLQALLDPDAVNALPENVRHDVEVPVKLPNQIREKLWIPVTDVKIKPDRAKVSLTIRKTTDSYSAPSLPILILAPWLELDRFSITLDRNRRVLDEPVQITGPSDTIEKVRQGQIKIWAELRLTADDLESGITSKPVYINLPPDVRLESPAPTLNFTITARPPKPAPDVTP